MESLAQSTRITRVLDAKAAGTTNQNGTAVGHADLRRGAVRGGLRRPDRHPGHRAQGAAVPDLRFRP